MKPGQNAAARKEARKQIAKRDKEIDDFLLSLTDVEFYQIRSRIEVGNIARNIMKQYNVSAEEIAKKMGVKNVKIYPNGARNFKIREIVKLQSLRQDFENKKSEADENNEQG